MEETGTEPVDVWGPIAMTNWRETPCIRGRVATEDDAHAGRAVFYLDLSDEQIARVMDIRQSTVRSTVYRALEALGRDLKETS